MADEDRILLGLGSNLPWRTPEARTLDSETLIGEMMQAVERFACAPVVRSKLYRTSPVDCPPGSGDFVNAAVAFLPRAGLSPIELLDELKAIERGFGRATTVRNAPRAADIDILAYGQTQLESNRLTLPHPRAWQRAFVLVPLCDVAPDFVWPGMELTVNQLLDRLDSDETVLPLTDACDLP